MCSIDSSITIVYKLKKLLSALDSELRIKLHNLYQLPYLNYSHNIHNLHVVVFYHCNVVVML